MALIHAEKSLDKSKLIDKQTKQVKVCRDSSKHMIVCTNKVIMRPQVQVKSHIVTWSHSGHFN